MEKLLATRQNRPAAVRLRAHATPVLRLPRRAGRRQGRVRVRAEGSRPRRAARAEDVLRPRCKRAGRASEGQGAGGTAQRSIRSLRQAWRRERDAARSRSRRLHHAGGGARASRGQVRKIFRRDKKARSEKAARRRLRPRPRHRRRRSPRPQRRPPPGAHLPLRRSPRRRPRNLRPNAPRPGSPPPHAARRSSLRESLPHPVLPGATQPAVASEARHSAALDGLRGFAVLLVFCVHAAGTAAVLFLGRDLDVVALPAVTSGGERLLFWLHRSHHGVFLFFVLSGFLIGRMWWPRAVLSYRAFAWRRTLRIYPAFLAAFVASLAFAYASGNWQPPDWPRIAGNLLFLNGAAGQHRAAIQSRHLVALLRDGVLSRVPGAAPWRDARRKRVRAGTAVPRYRHSGARGDRRCQLSPHVLVAALVRRRRCGARRRSARDRPADCGTPSWHLPTWR